RGDPPDREPPRRDPGARGPEGEAAQHRRRRVGVLALGGGPPPGDRARGVDALDLAARERRGARGGPQGLARRHARHRRRVARVVLAGAAGLSKEHPKWGEVDRALAKSLLAGGELKFHAGARKAIEE